MIKSLNSIISFDVSKKFIIFVAFLINSSVDLKSSRQGRDSDLKVSINKKMFNTIKFPK